jgi:hypothetical protein
MDDIQRNIDALRARLVQQAGAAADESGHLLESYAKAIAPWTDRTSNLRNSIKGRGWAIGNIAKVVISESMVYAPFVESGHFAKRNTTRMSTRKSGPTVQRISDRAYGTWVRARPSLWPSVAANTDRVMGIFQRHMKL